MTVGHRAIVHGARIGDNALIGMGAIILNGATIGNNCIVGAGALVTQNKVFPDNSLILGSPCQSGTRTFTRRNRHESPECVPLCQQSSCLQIDLVTLEA